MSQAERLSKAMRLFKDGQYRQAKRLCEQVIKNHAGDINAVYLKGKCEIRLGRYADAMSCLDIVAAQTPNNPRLMLEMGNLLRLSKKYERAIECLCRALELGAKNHRCHLELGFAYKALNRMEEAKTSFHKALDSNEACWDSARSLGEVYLADGDSAKAREIIAKHLTVVPANPHAYAALARLHLIEADAEAALAACQKSLAVEPAYTRGFALKYVALTELGRFQEASNLYDFGNLIQRIPAECPASFSDIRQFNEYLARHILEHPNLSRNGGEYAGAINGYHTGYDVLFEDNKELGKKVEKMIAAGVDEYVSRLSAVDPGHPIHTTRPKGGVRLRSWAVVTELDGFAAPHIHPRSWIGGAYYVQLPEDFRRQPTETAGWIEFGRAESQMHQLRSAITAKVEPVEGDFIIFPGYFWHSTVPLETNQKRICMAFDVEPVHGWGK